MMSFLGSVPSSPSPGPTSALFGHSQDINTLFLSDAMGQPSGMSSNLGKHALGGHHDEEESDFPEGEASDTFVLEGSGDFDFSGERVFVKVVHPPPPASTSASSPVSDAVAQVARTIVANHIRPAPDRFVHFEDCANSGSTDILGCTCFVKLLENVDDAPLPEWMARYFSTPFSAGWVAVTYDGKGDHVTGERLVRVLTCVAELLLGSNAQIPPTLLTTAIFLLKKERKQEDGPRPLSAPVLEWLAKLLVKTACSAEVVEQLSLGPEDLQRMRVPLAAIAGHRIAASDLLEKSFNGDDHALFCFVVASSKRMEIIKFSQKLKAMTVSFLRGVCTYQTLLPDTMVEFFCDLLDAGFDKENGVDAKDLMRSSVLCGKDDAFAVINELTKNFPRLKNTLRGNDPAAANRAALLLLLAGGSARHDVGPLVKKKKSL